MKLLFVPSKYNFSFSLKNIKANKLPKNIGLIATIQHTDSLNKIKGFLEKHKKKVIIGKSKKNNSLKKGQVLGCDINAAKAIENKVQAFLYIGSGKFHPLAIALSLKQQKKQKPIFIFNPLTEEFSCLDEKEIKKVIARKKTQKIKFLSSNTFGILVSIKPGQNRLKQALILKEKLEKKNKKSYLFLLNDFNDNQLENFPKVECWINTACPGLSLEQPFVWIDDINI